MEVISPVQSNPHLFGHALKAEISSLEKGFYNDKNIIYTTDTLSLPFIDDFSKNTTREYDYMMTNAYDSAMASGPCLTANGIAQQSTLLFLQRPYQYKYDTTTRTKDSLLTSSPSATFRYFTSALSGCFELFTTVTYWMPFYKYTKFDTLAGSPTYGLPTDSIWVEGDTSLGMAKLYYKHLSASTQWVDNYAWINSCFPIRPMSIGVATLDGLNAYGRPYDNSSSTRYGKADYLTSKPMNLSGLSNLDSVYLSFFYQPMGNGDYPNKVDSIIVDVKDKFGEWYTIWSDTGYSSPTATPNTEFKRAMIPIIKGPSISDPDPFFGAFQFRLRNKASLAGNNDHWNIDYVIVDKNRSQVDTIINDIAVINRFPSILKNYSLMPYKQFRGAIDLDTFVNMTVRNLNTLNTPTVDFAFNAIESTTSSSVYTAPSLSFTAGSTFVDRNINPRADYTPVSPVLTNVDYTYASAYQTKPTASNLLLSNDTVTSNQIFDNLLAYDCDCPVKGYGLEGAGLKKFAYEYTLNAPDTLAGIRILFTHINTDVDNLLFSLVAWDSIAKNSGIGGVDSIMTRISITKPNYVDTITGWTTYKFAQPVYVYNTFYIGWSQTDIRNIQIGYDITSPKGRDHMYVYTDGEWKKSTVLLSGSPMIRPILDGNYQGTSTSISNPLSSLEVFLYPMPFQDQITVESKQKLDAYEIISMYGQTLQKGNFTTDIINTISFSNLASGMYIIRIQSGEQFISRKIIKN